MELCLGTNRFRRILLDIVKQLMHALEPPCGSLKHTGNADMNLFLSWAGRRQIAAQIHLGRLRKTPWLGASPCAFAT